MPYEGENFVEGGRQSEDFFEGLSRESLDDAIRKAVHTANKSHGTWLRLVSIHVLSVDDPNVGGYKVTVTPGG
jgi:flavin-binding protein dodecin